MAGIIALILVFLVMIGLVVYIIYDRLTKVSLIDLKEFQDLNPTVKDAYKKYIADKIMSAEMSVINDFIKQEQIEKYLKDHDSEINTSVDSIIKKIKSNPIKYGSGL